MPDGAYMSTGRSSRAISSNAVASRSAASRRRADREERDDVEEVGEFDLNVVAVAQNLRGLVPGVPEPFDGHRDLGRIEIEDAVAAAHLFAEAVESVDAIDSPARLLRELDRAREQCGAFGRHLFARHVERRDHRQIRRRREKHLEHRLEAVEPDAARLSDAASRTAKTPRASCASS